MEVPSPRESAPTYVVKFKGIRASRPWQPSRGLELAPGVFSSGAVSMPLCIPLLPCGAPPQLSSTRGAGSIPEGHVVTTVPCSPRKLTLRDPPGLRVHRPPPPRPYGDGCTQLLGKLVVPPKRATSAGETLGQEHLSDVVCFIFCQQQARTPSNKENPFFPRQVES